MNDEDTERCAAAAMQLREKIATLLADMSDAVIFEAAPQVEQLIGWYRALDGCWNAAIRVCDIIDGSMQQPPKDPAEVLAIASPCA